MNNLARIPPRPVGSGQRWYNYIEQWLAYLSNRVWQIEKRLSGIPDVSIGLPFGGPTDPVIVTIPGGWGGGGGGGGTSGSRVELVTLEANFYRDQTVDGTVMETDESVVVDGIDTIGYFFQGWTIPCFRQIDGVYVPCCSGLHFVTGTLGSSLPSGGGVTLTIDDSGGLSVQVWGKFGAVTSGKKVGATWSDFSKRWQVNTAEC